MAYTKQKFEDGQILTADALNHMEDGIAAAMEQTGASGKDGVSPTIQVSETSDGVTLTIKDANGTKSVAIKNGKDGVDGKDGATGATGATGKTGATGAQGPQGEPGEGFTETAKTLILALFEGAAYGNESMQATLDSLKEEWNGGGSTVVEVQSVTLNKSTLTLTEGNSETLTATISPSNATNKTVSWSVSPAGYATVSGGVVRAVKAGSCTVTAACGGKSATCAVTVETASSGSDDTQDIAGETPVYKLAVATEIAPEKKNAIDTGIKLFDSIDPKPDITILLEIEYNESVTSTTKQHAILHCMQESDPWPGFVFKGRTGNNTLQFNMYDVAKAMDEASVLIGQKRRYAFKITESKIFGWNYNGAAIGDSAGNAISKYTSTVSNNVILGAAQDTSGNLDCFFDGTIHQCLIYKKALTDTQIKGWVTAG